MADLVYAPFTPLQVENLNAYQEDGRFHPFTCGIIRDDGGPDCPGFPPGVHAALVATEDGWVCPACPYTQNWAHAFMADGSLT